MYKKIQLMAAILVSYYVNVLLCVFLICFVFYLCLTIINTMFLFPWCPWVVDT